MEKDKKTARKGKEILANVKLAVPAGKASPAPPIGPALGQRGINIMDFCKKFNEQSKSYPEGTLLPVVLTVYNDRSFDFKIKTPITSYLLKRSASIEKGSSEAKRKFIGKISREKIIEIANIKLQDTNAYSLEGAVKMVEGTAKSMGLEIE